MTYQMFLSCSYRYFLLQSLSQHAQLDSYENTATFKCLSHKIFNDLTRSYTKKGAKNFIKTKIVDDVIRPGKITVHTRAINTKPV